MAEVTVDHLIETRVRVWFPTIDIGAAADIQKIRRDLEGLTESIKAKLLAEGAETRATILARLDTLPRYEPELKTDGDEVGRYEAVMKAVEPGQPASFVSIQSIRDALK